MIETAFKVSHTQLSLGIEAEPVSRGLPPVVGHLPTRKFIATSGLILALTLGSSPPQVGQVHLQLAPLVDQTSGFVAGGSEVQQAVVRGEGKQNDTVARTTSELIRAAHDTSGLTWDQISGLFDVSRRAVHHWASGGRVTARHTEMIAAFARLVDSAPGESAEMRRTWLFSAEPGQPSPIEALLASYRLERTPVVGSGYTSSQLLGTYGD